MHLAVLGTSQSWYCRELRRVAEERGHQTALLNFERLSARVGPAGSSFAEGPLNLAEFQAAIVRTMPPGSLEQVVYRMDVLARLQAAGLQVLNSPRALECAIDKYLTTARLAAAGLSVPETAVCEDADSAMEAFAALGGDVVVKPIFGSEGRGIVRVSDPDLAFRTFRTLARIQAVLYLQRFIDHAGFDVRVLVLDGKIVGGMRRRASGDFRTNVARSAQPEAHAPSDLEREWAFRSAAAVEARFAGVDILYDREERGYVIEVNAVPGWRAFQRVTGIDVAALVIHSLESGGVR